MSGAEAAGLALGLVSSVIAICEATADIWQAAHDTSGLPKKLKTAADELPLISASLDKAKSNVTAATRRPNGIDISTWQSIQQVFKSCEESAKVVKQVFEKYLPAENDDRKAKYTKILSLERKSGQVQENIHKILQLIQTLANHQILKDAQILEDIQAAVEELEAPGEDEDKGGSQFMYGDGDNNYASGSGTVRTYKNSGSAPMYNAENMTQHFEKVEYNYNSTYAGGKTYDISFFKTSNYTAFKDAPNPRPKPNTCLWFIEHPTFIEWMRSDLNKILWLIADPGCGKSVLSRFLIDEVFPQQSGWTILHFFFKDETTQRDICVAMCAIIHQLLDKKPQLSKYAMDKITTNGDTLKGDFDGLWQLFLQLAFNPEAGRVVCLFDGLDECEKSECRRLTSKLHDFSTAHCVERQLHDTDLKFFIASRPYSQIMRRFAIIQSRSHLLRLDADAEQSKINIEIESVIRAEMDEYGNGLKLSEQ